MSQPCVMVVDDDEALRESVCELLEEDGLRTLSADSGASALRRLREDSPKPDLILLDLTMPIKNGWQFREEQLSDPELSGIPVVVMSASRDVKDISADEVVYKPVTLEKLLDVVHRHAPRRLASLRRDDEVPASGVEPRSQAHQGPLSQTFSGGGEVGALMAALDWSNNPLGPPDTWPQSLRTCVRIVLASRQPMFIWWGEQLINLYNDAYLPIIGDKHPAALGKPAPVVWRELWHRIRSRVETVMRGNQGSYDEAFLLVTERHGYEEETYYTFSYSPVPNDSGGTGGLLCTSTDDTARVIDERQLALLRELGGGAAEARTLDEVCRRSAEALGTNPKDIPFALIYLASDDRTRWQLFGSLRLEPGSRAAPRQVARNDGSTWPLDEAFEDQRIHFVDHLEARFGSLPKGAWERAPSRAAVVPIGAPGEQGHPGLLVAGLSPFRRVDESYRSFLRLVAGQLSASIAHAQSYESERADAFVREALRWLPDASDSNAALPPTQRAGPGDGGRRARILVADDSADMRDYLRRLLEVHWDVDVVEDDVKALELARREPPDLVLTDVMMPGLDGFALRRELRKEEKTQWIPVLMLAARAGEETELDGLEPGTDDYLAKPFSARELVVRVRSLLELARLRRDVLAQQEHLYSLFMQAPAPICVVKGRELVYEVANELYFKVCGRRDIVGKRMLEALPELRDQGLEELLLSVMNSGKTCVGKERLLKIAREDDGRLEDTYWTFTYAPLRGPELRIDRVMAFCNDVTEQVLARRAIERSEERFRGLVTQVQAGIAEKDLSGRFILTNDRYREIVGRSARELSQLREQDITHPDDLASYTEAFERLTRHGMPFVIEKRYIKPDGSIVWVQNSVARIDDASGHPHGIATVSIDITQRKYAERALQTSEARYRAIFETVEVSLWEEDFSLVQPLLARWKHEHGPALRQFLEEDPLAVDEAMALVKVRDVNPATLRMFDASDKRQLLGSLSTVFLPETRAVFVEELLAVADGRTVFESESALRTLSGERIDVLLTMSFGDGEAGCERVLVSLMDISPQKAAQREREARLVEVERAVRFSEMFTGILGHDLRNPLSAIMSAASLLSRRSEESERISKPVSRILTSADRMERMISQLLDFTCIRLGRGIPLEPTTLDLGDLCRLVIEEVETAWSTDIDVSCSGELRGCWDGDRLSQLISNLAVNACQHRPPGTPIRITLDGTRDDAIRLEVRNQGAIPEELVPVIFEPLRQVGENQQKRAGSSGLGLGLYITEQIAIAHGGSIRVRSDSDAGTRFAVVLPRSAHPEGDRAFSPTTPSTIPPPGSQR